MQNFELADIDFTENFTQQAAGTFSPELRKSNTVEALIAQNEDVTARLKIALRRMQMLEDENAQLQQDLTATKIAHSSTSDQMLVWKEKEKIWKERNEKAEEALQAFRDRFPETLRMEAKQKKHQKFSTKQIR
jgi:hypothetical protein